MLKAGIKVAGLTLVSRILGFVRDVCIALFIGAGASADTFFAAYRIPLFLRQFLAEGALANAWVPILANVRQQHGEAQARQLIARALGCLLSLLIPLTLVMVALAPVLTSLYAPGFLARPEQFDSTVVLVRIMTPYLMFVSVATLLAGILNCYGRFTLPALGPVLFNMTLISALVGVSALLFESVLILSIAVVVGGMLQCLLMLPMLLSKRLLPRPHLQWRDPDIKRVLVLMAPAALSTSVTQVNVWFDTMIASFLPTGSISWLYFAERLKELPIGVFAVALATVMLPNLARYHQSQSLANFRSMLDWGIRLSALISLPAATALFLLGTPIIFSLFGYGSLQQQDVIMITLGLQAYVIGLPAFMVIRVLLPGYYAQEDGRSPVKISIIAVVISVILSALFAWYFHHTANTGHMGLALGTACGGIIQALLLLLGLYRKGSLRFGKKSWLFLLRILLATIVMGLVLLWFTAPTDDWFKLSPLARISQLSVLCLSGAGVYFITLGVLGMRPSQLRQVTMENTPQKEDTM